MHNVGKNDRAEGSPIEERVSEERRRRRPRWQCWHANKGNEIRHSRRERKVRGSRLSVPRKDERQRRRGELTKEVQGGPGRTNSF